MSARFPLVQCIARVVIKVAGNALGFGVMGDLAAEIWESWSRQTSEPERQAEMEALAQEDPAVRAEIAEAARAAGGGETAQLVETYLRQVPAQIRRTLRRPSDPTGRTLPRSLLPRKAEDLLTFLPTQLPRFKPGDRPLAGVDWELEELLGVGGFGEVWKARNPHFSALAPVALKFCTDEESRDRLLRHEAGVLMRILQHGAHDGIVTLRHTYLSADPPCLEYEYMGHGDLGSLVQEWHRARGGPSPRQVARIVLRLAEIVGHFHSLKPPIVHRDLKPSNILLTQKPDGQTVLKVADFGIGGLATTQAIRQTRMATGQGQLLTQLMRGSYTPLYASREQMHGSGPDPRDDVHALGVIWYQMLIGDMTRGAPAGLAWPKRLLERGMTQAQINLLASCFDDAENRPTTAQALVAELSRLFPTEKPPARASSGRAATPAAVRPAPPQALAPPPPPAEDLDSGSQVIALDDEEEEPSAPAVALNPVDLGQPGRFRRLAGESVITAPVFAENVATFAPAYGLCLQALKRSPITASLTPPDRQGWLGKMTGWLRSGPRGVWAIDMGQVGMKALCADFDPASQQVLASSFDYVEYPRILSQPDADPDQLMREALETFLERNSVRGHQVALCIPGASCLVRFIKLPPVEDRKIEDIIRFEAKQAIPFPLDDVVWSWQHLPGSSEVVDGFRIGAEILILAVKKDFLGRCLEPFQEQGIEVGLVQVSPLCLAGFLAYDLLGKGPEGGKSAEKPTCLAALDLGADTSTLVITDGAGLLWQRPVPIGGNHFTKALTKELKLTFAKAEHLKRNAAKSSDLRRILTALKPVYQDLVGDVQRSLGYFANTHRQARVESLVALGNGFRLPGAKKFMQEKLQLEVKTL